MYVKKDKNKCNQIYNICLLKAVETCFFPFVHEVSEFEYNTNDVQKTKETY